MAPPPLTSDELATARSVLPKTIVQELLRPTAPPTVLASAAALLDAHLATLLPFVPSPARDIHLATESPARIAGLYRSGTVLVAALPVAITPPQSQAADERKRAEEAGAYLNELVQLGINKPMV